MLKLVKDFNFYKLVTSGLMFLFAIYCVIFQPTLPFSFPKWVYVIFTLYYSVFPIKDMISKFNKTLYKGKQFKKNYIVNCELDKNQFDIMKEKYDKGAVRSIIFWLSFMAVIGGLYFTKLIGKQWIFFFFAMSDFCVYFAIFFWCPFHKILLKPHCCMDCRIFNWDSFFSFSFLVFIPSVYTYVLFVLSLISLIEWEITYNKYPERFYIYSNKKLSCENCDLIHCKNNRKKKFSSELKEECLK